MSRPIRFRQAIGVPAMVLVALLASPRPGSPQGFGPSEVDALLREIATGVERGATFWNARYGGSRILILMDASRDYLRIVTPIASAAELDEAALRRLLTANFDRALDAKFALSEGVLWSIYSHPLSRLTRPELLAGLQQVVRLRDNYGGTNASTDRGPLER